MTIKYNVYLHKCSRHSDLSQWNTQSDEGPTAAEETVTYSLTLVRDVWIKNEINY